MPDEGADTRERAQLAWADATAALEHGDLDAFAAESRTAALTAAAAGNARAARGLVALRADLIERARATPEPTTALAAVLAELATGAAATDPELLWAYAIALVGELPPRHPLPAAVTDLGLDPTSATVVLAALAAGDAASVELLSVLVATLPEVIEPLVHELVASGALVDLGDGLVAAAPLLRAVCALEPSPFALAPMRSRFSLETFGASTFDSDGVFIAESTEPAVALATLRAARIPAIVVPPEQRDDGAALSWLARDADWRGVPLLLELDAPPTPDQQAILAVVARAIIIPAAPATAATIGEVVAAHRSDVVAWTPQEIAPARAADALATALRVPAGQLHVGWLHASDIDELVDEVTARGLTGDDAAWALKEALAQRAAAELAPFVFGAAPELPTGVLDRARELLAVDGGWSGRVSALVAPLTVAAPVALALAADRGMVAATLALGAADGEARMERAMAAARRWGAVLCVGIDRAPPSVLAEFARKLARGGVVVVIGVRPGTPIPLALAPLVSTLTV